MLMANTQLTARQHEEGIQAPPTEIKMILAAIDGSRNSDDALHLAAQIAQRFSAQVDLVHVHSMPAELVGMPASGSALHPLTPQTKSSTVEQRELARTLILEDEAMLLDRKKWLQGRQIRSEEISVSLEKSSSIGDEIARVCKEGNYDFVALGNRGQSGVRSFFLGSVSKKVASDASCSVLISKNSNEQIQRILLAYDGSPGSKKALMMAAALARRFGAVVNVVSAISNRMLSSEVVVSTAVEAMEEEMRYYGNEAKSKLNELGVNSEEPKILGSIEISKAIAEEAGNGFYDLVVLGNRGWGKARYFFLGSTASGVVDLSRTNVLIVK